MSRSSRLFSVIAVAGSALGCGGLPDHGAPPALDGPLLSFDAYAAARGNAALLPSGFTVPQQTACAADVTRGFIAEIVDHGFDQAQVQYQWAPILSGPSPNGPTLGQPELALSGTVKAVDHSALDLRFSHPFGFDESWDIAVDDRYQWLVYDRPGDGVVSIHAEIESGLYPEAAFGLPAAPGDRVLLKGAWIFDCGHPQYEAELHPPTFAAFARAQDQTTVSLAFANPYRVTQLYGPAQLATAFSHDARYGETGVAPFLQRFKAELLSATFGQLNQLELHGLVEAPRFDALTWFVCAPDPKPSPSSSLGYSYRFVARTGVTISAARRGDSGCLELTARMSDAYQPATPAEVDQAWPWAQVSDEAAQQYGSPIDVRQTILDQLAKNGITGDVVALHADNAPVIETFDALAPRSGADQDSPTKLVSTADDQPFPFYGRVKVYWK